MVEYKVNNKSEDAKMERIFITGAGGFVGARACQRLQGSYTVLTPPKGWMAACTEEQLTQMLTEMHPEVILHTAAISDTGYAESHPEEAYRANVQLPLWLARAAAQSGAKLVAFSSDQVYAGVQQPGPLAETMPLSPANVYGRQKLEMEQRVLEVCPDAVLLRATWMYDLPGYGLPIRGNLPLNLAKAALYGEKVRVSSRDYRGITYVRQAVENLLPATALPGGVYNYGSENQYDMVTTTRAFAESMQLPNADTLIEAADWPRNLAMDCAKLHGHGIRFDATQDGICRCLRDYGLIK